MIVEVVLRTQKSELNHESNRSITPKLRNLDSSYFVWTPPVETHIIYSDKICHTSTLQVDDPISLYIVYCIIAKVGDVLYS